MTSYAAGCNAVMIHNGPSPGVCRMAVVAVVAALDMVDRLAQRSAAIVTAGAASGHAAVVEDRTAPAAGVVAVVAVVAAWYVIDRLAQGDAAVVTARAAAQHVAMIDPQHRYPAAAAVTVFADIAGGNVIDRFARRGAAIVTAGAASGHAAVVEYRTAPTAGIVAVVTGITAWYMVCRFTCRFHPIVTTTAMPQNLVMIGLTSHIPTACDMTCFTPV